MCQRDWKINSGVYTNSDDANPLITKKWILVYHNSDDAKCLTKIVSLGVYHNFIGVKTFD